MYVPVETVVVEGYLSKKRLLSIFIVLICATLFVSYLLLKLESI